MDDLNHVRAQVRQRAADILTGLPTAKTRVHNQRRFPLGKEALPALLVYTNDELSNRSSTTADGDNRQALEIELAVNCLAGASDDAGDIVDMMAAEVEEALFADPTLGGLLKDLTYEGSNAQADADGEIVIENRELIFNALIHTAEGSPREALD